MTTKEDVKDSVPVDNAPKSANPPVDKDARGVSWENTAKEYERKFNELKAEVAALKSVPPTPEKTPVELQEDIKKELLSLAENPRKYVSAVANELLNKDQISRELPQAEKWIRSQDGFKTEDEAKIVSIIQENNLYHLPPLKRAETAWKLLKADAISAELVALRVGKNRENTLSKSSPDGSQKSTPVIEPTNRANLLALLRDAEKKGDVQKAAEIVGALEDVRE